jgi:hypothetical protein
MIRRVLAMSVSPLSPPIADPTILVVASLPDLGSRKVDRNRNGKRPPPKKVDRGGSPRKEQQEKYSIRRYTYLSIQK